MKNWLFMIFHGHQYAKPIQQGTISDDDGSVIGRWYDCQCLVCGRIKRFKNLV